MTRADIVDRIYEKVGLSKKEAQEIIEIIIDTITETLKEGETVKITGFGTFTVRKKAPRKGRNPKTGEEVEISARRVVSFRPSNILKEKVNT
jgi:integration host factor subunit alpha